MALKIIKKVKGELGIVTSIGIESCSLRPKSESKPESHLYYNKDGFLVNSKLVSGVSLIYEDGVRQQAKQLQQLIL